MSKIAESIRTHADDETVFSIYDEVWKLHNEGLKSAQISEQVSMCPSTVSRICMAGEWCRSPVGSRKCTLNVNPRIARWADSRFGENPPINSSSGGAEKDLLSVIAALQAENAELRKRARPSSPPRRPLCPVEVAQKYGHFELCRIASDGVRSLEFMDAGDLSALGMLIRDTCFAPRAAVRNVKGKQMKSSQSVRLLEMSDEQYARYAEIMEKLLDVLHGYAVPLADREKTLRVQRAKGGDEK